jgi:hypothetical protein
MPRSGLDGGMNKVFLARFPGKVIPLAKVLPSVNDLVVRAAVALGLEDGAKLRVDTTVVETDIHHPTDNTLGDAQN